MMIVAATATAQSSDCPGWKNPNSFNTGSTDYFWTARVGDRVSSGASSGYTVYSTCAASNCPNITGNSNITSSTYNTGSDAGITCCSHGDLWDAAQDHRFMIIHHANAGIDQLTVNGSNGMPRIPPGYTTSIRLGDPRSSYQGASNSFNWSSSHPNKSSEALFYTMKVTPMNALLIINYAVVGRCYDHNPSVAGEFLIRVVKQNSDGTWPNAPINDSMWFRISAPPIPASGVPDLPWVMGRPGTYCSSTTCAYVYKPWAKAAISLSQYLYENVRVELYTSDCVPTVDPIYAYIAGDYQPMLIHSIGCADARSEAIDTLTAPEGLLSYTWYVAQRGSEIEIYNPSHMDTVPFRQVSATSTSNIYTPTLADFIVHQGPNAGDTIATQTFLCKMTSALDPNKVFSSKVYANVTNHKPMLYYQASPDCDQNIQFTDLSYGFGSDEIEGDSIRWIIYSDTLCTSVLDTLWGVNATYHFPDEGYYKVAQRVKVFNRDCGNEQLFVCRAYKRHPVPILLADTIVCEGETAMAYCGADCGMQKRWLIGDSVVRPDEFHSRDTVTWLPALGLTTLQLTTYTDSLCPATTYATLKTLGNSQIASTLDPSILCLGDTAQLSAVGIDAPYWTSVPYDSTLAAGQGQNTVSISPAVTTTYYVQPSHPTRCTQDAPPITVIVLRYPEPRIWANKSFVDLANPILYLEDRSLYGNSSHWTFSDGQHAEGGHIEHTFATADDSVTIFLRSCNEERCCADTSLSLPFRTNALWIPNTFTPDGPGNTHFRFFTTLDIIDFEINIYDRHGLLVYHGTDFDAGWDGKTADGTPCPQGAYAYQYTYILADTPTHKHNGIGTVTLLR